MSCGGPLSSVMMIAGAGMLPGASAISGLGSSLGVSSSLTSALGSFTSLPISGQFSDIVTSATSVLSGGTLDSLRTLGADIFPALTNAIPGNFAAALGPIASGGVFDGGFTGLISQTASGIMGSGDTGIFSQIFDSASGFIGQANQFINTSLNLDNLSNTFSSITGGMDNLITGSFNQVSQAFGSLGGDLGNLGNLIDMGNLPNLGDPSALLKQVVNVGGLTPAVEGVLNRAGIDARSIASLTTNFPGVSASANKLLYQGMSEITGTDLAQVKSILGVTTPGINNMAEFLDPSKILPNSYKTLTMPTPDGLRGIYTSAGSVNTNLEKFLKDPNAPEYTGDDPIIRARLGLAPLDESRTLTA